MKNVSLGNIVGTSGNVRTATAGVCDLQSESLSAITEVI
jgi:hypothetical protein